MNEIVIEMIEANATTIKGSYQNIILWFALIWSFEEMQGFFYVDWKFAIFQETGDEHEPLDVHQNKHWLTNIVKKI